MKKKYYYNEDFFKEINTESKAYFLGLLYADGYINDKLKYVELTLHEDDNEIINRFIVELKSNRKPVFIKNKKYCRIIINSEKMVNDLIVLGCTNNKTHSLKFPNNISDKLMHHMIRGYFDGDGSIWCTAKRNQYNVQFDGNHDFLIGIRTIINNHLSIDNKLFTKRHKSRIDNIVTLKYGGNCVVKKIYDYLYFNANFYINRKRNKFLLVNCKYNTQYEYNGINYSGHNIHQLFDLIENNTGLKRNKIHSRLMSGWNVYDIIKYGKHDKNKKSVSKYDLDNNFLEKYCSIEMAAKFNNANPDAISRNAKKHKKYKNFYWRLDNE